MTDIQSTLPSRLLPYRGKAEYMQTPDAALFTMTFLPEENGTFPTVIFRTPYVDRTETMDETAVLLDGMKDNLRWLQNGYAVVLQHCRGRGKSGGDCVPYINEREDTLALYDFVRAKSFYNGELFLRGESYLASVHYAAAPFADDVKGAVFGVQDCERYNICYRNGFMKKALHGDWYVSMYKTGSHLEKHFTHGSFDTLPLANFSELVFGEPTEDFDAMLANPDPESAFWNTRSGGADARHAVRDAGFPVLLTTGFYDIYTGGIFDLWNGLSESTRKRSALLVSPYDHGDGCPANSILFPNGRKKEAFGENYDVAWFDFIRGKRQNAPFEQDKVTYYRLFENRWQTDSFRTPEKTVVLPLGNTEATYLYNPYDPPSFRGGLCTNFGGAEFQDAPHSRHDIISVYSEPFASDSFIKGKMRARLLVRTDCEDTCFYVRVSLVKDQGDYGLRDDITSVCREVPAYRPGEKAYLDFTFDEHAFLIRKGERLRVDIASADNAHYVRHTNLKGLYSRKERAVPAHNTVFLGESVLILPVE